jgi:uncharacterized membrane protein YgcG
MKRAALILCLLFASAAGAALPEKPAGYVSDFAGLLEEPAKSALEGLLFRTEQETSAEISVVTVASLDGRDIEGYALDVSVLKRHLGPEDDWDSVEDALVELAAKTKTLVASKH